MTINKKKSGIMMITKNRTAKKEEGDKWERQEEFEGYPIVENYKYLGIMFDSSLRFDM